MNASVTLNSLSFAFGPVIEADLVMTGLRWLGMEKTLHQRRLSLWTRHCHRGLRGAAEILSCCQRTDELSTSQLHSGQYIKAGTHTSWCQLPALAGHFPSAMQMGMDDAQLCAPQAQTAHATIASVCTS